MSNWYAQLKNMYLNQVQAITRPGVIGELNVMPSTISLFGITGADVQVLGIIGKIIATKQAAAQTLDLGFTPTAGIRRVFATACGNTTGDVLDKYYTWSGVIGGALLDAQTGNVIGFGTVNALLNGTTRVTNVFCPGIISTLTAGATDNIGLINWTILYKPMSIASRVAAL